jgi:hypothetical protein
MFHQKDNSAINRNLDDWSEVHAQLQSVQRKSDTGKETGSGVKKIHRATDIATATPVSRDVKLPYYFKAGPNKIAVYKLEKGAPEDASAKFVEEHLTADSFTLSITDDCTIYIAVTEEGYDPDVAYGGEEKAGTDVTFNFTIKDQDAFGGENWSGSQYEKVYNNLTQTSAGYQTLVKDFRGPDASAPYNLELNYAKKPGQQGSGLTTTSDLYGSQPDTDSPPMPEGTVKTYFSPDFDTRTGANSELLKMNDLGRALNIIHEGLHANLFIEKGIEYFVKPVATHLLMATDEYRNKIVTALKEFVTANKFEVTDLELEIISWQGLFAGPDSFPGFVAWFKSKNLTESVYTDFEGIDYHNKDNKEKLEKLVETFNQTKIEPVIYNGPDNPDRYMIK